jgi:hypothetical protein
LRDGLSRVGRAFVTLVLCVCVCELLAQPSAAAGRPLVRSARGLQGPHGLRRTASPSALRVSPGVGALLHLRNDLPAVPSPLDPTPAHWIRVPHPHRVGVTNGAESTNWSGEIATGIPFTGVDAEWVVPTVQASVTDKFSATWIGIDGATNSSLIQVGTNQDSMSRATAYGAWYEILPAPQVPISEPVSPGDVIDASVTEQSPGTWEIVIEDVTANWSGSGDFSYNGPGTTAEWIEEAPTVNHAQSTLADFGTMTFNDLTISSPSSDPAGLTPVAMENSSGVVISYPGPYNASNDSFPITYGTPAPVVDSLSPSQGSIGGATAVTINGDYLTGASSVSFGGIAAPFTQDFEDSSLTATAPAEPAGTVDVTVTTPGGASARTNADEFTYVQPPPQQTPTPSSGYDLVGRDGGVFVFPTNQSGGFYGSLPGLGVRVSNIVGMVPTATDQGYFLVGSDGGVFAFGNAPFFGSLPGDRAHIDDIVGIVPTSDDQGYFLVGRDGGVFAFGNAPFLGSLPGRGVHVDDIIGIAANPSDQGYWLIAANGQVYAFGNAVNFGSATGSSSPVTAIESTPDGGGYWVVFQNGSVYTYGDAGFHGSLPGLGVTPAHPVIGLVPTADDGGYWLIGSDGGIFAFGDAPFVGSLPGLGVSVTDVVGAVPTKV